MFSLISENNNYDSASTLFLKCFVAYKQLLLNMNVEFEYVKRILLSLSLSKVIKCHSTDGKESPVSFCTVSYSKFMWNFVCSFMVMLSCRCKHGISATFHLSYASRQPHILNYYKFLAYFNYFMPYATSLGP